MLYTIIGVAVAIVLIGAVFFLLYRRRRLNRPQVPENEAGETAEVKAKSPAPAAATKKVEASLPPPPPLLGTTALTDEEKQTLANAVWYRCENPYCNYTRFLDVHQIVPGTNGGSKALDNLIVLCPRCLKAVKDKQVATAVLKDWVQKRPKEFRFELKWPYK
jgi:5-methylcytosine-specific restriction endonuclease McrA